MADNFTRTFDRSRPYSAVITIPKADQVMLYWLVFSMESRDTTSVQCAQPHPLPRLK